MEKLQKEDAVLSNFLKRIDEGFPYYYGKETNRYGDLLKAVDSDKTCLHFLEKIAEEEDPLGSKYRNTLYAHVDRLWETDPNLAAGLMASITRLFLRHDSIFFTRVYLRPELQVTNPTQSRKFGCEKQNANSFPLPKKDFRHLAETTRRRWTKQRFLGCRHNRASPQIRSGVMSGI
jgi:hypothetical protein